MSLVINNIKQNIIPVYKDFLRRELSTAVYFSDKEVEDINIFIKTFLKIDNIKFSNEIDINLFHTIFESMERRIN
jgi:hypothetical protein